MVLGASRPPLAPVVTDADVAALENLRPRCQDRTDEWGDWVTLVLRTFFTLSLRRPMSLATLAYPVVGGAPIFQQNYWPQRPKMEREAFSKRVEQVQVQPSGSDVSKVESGISQTLGLVGALTTEQAQKRSLGFWKVEALDEHHGQCRIPVLRIEEFMSYMIDVDGSIPISERQKGKGASKGDQWPKLSLNPWSTPSQSSSPSYDIASAGTSCWAYFLYSLGIRPNMNLIQWRPQVDQPANSTNGGIQLEIDGSVLCHIINLYSIVPYAHGRPRVRHAQQLPDRRRIMRCDFDFGQLDWHYVDDEVRACFSPGSEFDIASAKQAFGSNAKLVEEGTAMATYLTTLENRPSDSK
ncbi:hypothetical protein CSAL01_10638 [Colletotrichum salicis]|uniref:Uncharacterized protein n=1 Tax=Colletotrichum salicis TaxID=1209931 RepID=A0A135S404_9PEZI|nr:hypothetical protein CSAL01_10638 [Colletotrichum salicis]